jgi:hypothetical protein
MTGGAAVVGRMRSGSAPLLAVALTLVAAATATGDERVVVQIATVLATNTGEHFDAQLATMRRHLEKLPHYQSYELVSRESRDVGRGDPFDVELPGGRVLRVLTKSVNHNRVSLNVLLRQDSRVVVRTDVTLGPGGTVLVGGPRHRNGVLIIWIGAQPVAQAR